MLSTQQPAKQLESTKGRVFPPMTDREKAEMEAYCQRYSAFLSSSKSIRTAVKNSIELARQHGFEPFQSGKELLPGDRVFLNNRDLSVFFAVIGKTPPTEGMNIVAAHIDSPRLDVRVRPLVERDGLAFFQTHYYGWTRNYQWVSLPLMLQGIVVTKNKEKIEVSIGGTPGEPHFVITDLLPHIAQEQNKLPLGEAHAGEMMNVLMASLPSEGGSACDDRVRHTVLEILHAEYGIVEDDLLSADLEFNPALPVSDVGLDRSMLGGYGQDDRVCAFAGLDALLELEQPEKTAVLLWVDREEVGNNGISGIRSQTVDYFLSGLCQSDEAAYRTACFQSYCLSADVTSAFDPKYAAYYSKENSARLNHGVAICKFTGFRGKEQTSEASAEVLAYLRTILDQYNVPWQTAEMGRIDLGGGCTVALEMANRGINTVDAGVPVLGMHSPFEVVGKLDCFATRQACRAVFYSSFHHF